MQWRHSRGCWRDRGRQKAWRKSRWCARRQGRLHPIKNRKRKTKNLVRETAEWGCVKNDCGRVAVKTALTVVFLASSLSVAALHNEGLQFRPKIATIPIWKGCSFGPKPQPFFVQRAAILTITATLLTQKNKKKS